jgi:putative Mg2+ transporter-C (MgtC) family protein
MLLCLGCAFFTMLSAVLAGETNPDKGRVASNIVQGIGFLGAGLILQTRSRTVGLTSAATVFVVASIGMACGAWLYLEALLATVITLIALTVIGTMEGKAAWKYHSMLYEVRGSDQNRMYVAILSVLDRAGVRLNIVDRDSFAGIERMTFLVSCDRRKHESQTHQLRDNDATAEVVVFPDVEEE